jgi:hypothetical protein
MSIYRVKLAEEKFVPKKDVVLKKDVDFNTNKTSDKSKKPFNPNDPDPGFDPNAEATTTVPSEITALEKEQQKHIMKQSARPRKMNQPGYKFYLVNQAGNKIRSGWEYLEDAKDAKADDPKSGKILQLRGLKALGLDPNVNSFWDDDRVGRVSTKKPAFIGKEMKTAMQYLSSTQARDDVFYAEKDEDKD